MANGKWDQNKVHQMVLNQRAFFQIGKTLDVSWRIEQLKALRGAVKSHEAQILQVPLPVILAKPLSKQRKALVFVKPNQSRIRLTIQIDQCASDLVLHIAELIHGHCLMTDTIISRPSFRFREV